MPIQHWGVARLNGMTSQDSTQVDDKAYLLEARSNAILKPAMLGMAMLLGFAMTFSQHAKTRDAGHSLMALTAGGLLTLLQAKTERGAAYSPAPTTINLAQEPPRLPLGEARYSWQRDGLYGRGNEFSAVPTPPSTDHESDGIGVQISDEEI